MTYVDIRRLTSFLVLGLVLLAAAPARATLSGANDTNFTGFTCPNGNDGNGSCSRSAAFTVNNPNTFTSRYAWNVNADIGIASTRDSSSNAQHNITFTATAPGGYRLDITTSRVGAIGRSGDASNCDGQADTSGVTGSSNIAVSGTLSLGDPGGFGNGGGNANTPYSQSTAAATLFRVSNGVGQNHTLTFTWNGSVRSNSCEASVRQGENSGSTSGCEICGYPGSPSRTQSTDGHFVTVAFTSLCGNGTIDGSVGEACDTGSANGSFGNCCNANCTFASSSTVCRNAAGVCDNAENCTGSSATCPADGFKSSSTLCRGVAGDCDVPENCTGSSPGCPFDFFANSLTQCRASGGVCDPAENCTGSGPNCPADAKSTAVCRPSAGVCDVAESCDGINNACPANNFLSSSTVCRGSAGDCDVAENCTGSSAACPANAFQPSSVTCRGAAGVCDIAENCTGSSATCPADSVSGAFVECRPSAGVCDPAENCDGVGVNCPADALSPASTVCRASAGVCDVADNCTGSSANCPADVKVTAGTACTADSNPCTLDQCDGTNNACQHPAGNSGASCRASAGVCDVGETCDGVSTSCPADGFVSSSTPCRASAGVCDVTENCTGSSANCPADGFVSSSTPCRPSAGACDIVENCTGSGANCPADSVSGAFVQCRAASGACDLAENCDGIGVNCPADGVKLIGTVCRAGVDICDAVEVCDGVSKLCPTDLAAPNGTSCNDNNACSGPDTCQSGVCTGVPNAGSCADHYLCYKTKGGTFTAVPNVNLIDQFENINVTVSKVKMLCPPADKNSEGIADNVTHLQTYSIRANAGTPAFIRRTHVKVENQFGTLFVDAYKRDLLLVPANKSLVGPTTPPNINSIGVDHYKCYKAKVTPGTPKFVAQTVQIADQFTSPAKGVTLKKIKHLCTPVNKNGEGIKNPDAHLACYQAKTAKGQPKHVKRTGVNTANQFGALVIGTNKESEFCVPSLKTVGP